MVILVSIIIIQAFRRLLYTHFMFLYSYISQESDIYTPSGRKVRKKLIDTGSLNFGALWVRTVVLRWFYSGFTVVLYGGSKVVLQWFYDAQDFRV